MASSEKDEDTMAKGKELWAALKRDPLDSEEIKLLLEFGAPPNFREPGSKKVSCKMDKRNLYLELV